MASKELSGRILAVYIYFIVAQKSIKRIRAVFQLGCVYYAETRTGQRPVQKVETKKKEAERLNYPSLKIISDQSKVELVANPEIRELYKRILHKKAKREQFVELPPSIPFFFEMFLRKLDEKLPEYDAKNFTKVRKMFYTGALFRIERKTTMQANGFAYLDLNLHCGGALVMHR